MIHSRRQAREAAIQALYQCDVQENWSKDLIDFYFEVYCAADQESDSGVFASQIICGVSEARLELDKLIESASKNWKIDRMSRIDRNILRLAVYELKHLEDVPAKVSINEAIELAKHYGGDESSQFVNGVLDKIMESLGVVDPRAANE